MLNETISFPTPLLFNSRPKLTANYTQMDNALASIASENLTYNEFKLFYLLQGTNEFKRNGERFEVKEAFVLNRVGLDSGSLTRARHGLIKKGFIKYVPYRSYEVLYDNIFRKYGANGTPDNSTGDPPVELLGDDPVDSTVLEPEDITGIIYKSPKDNLRNKSTDITPAIAGICNTDSDIVRENLIRRTINSINDIPEKKIIELIDSIHRGAYKKGVEAIDYAVLYDACNNSFKRIFKICTDKGLDKYKRLHYIFSSIIVEINNARNYSENVGFDTDNDTWEGEIEKTNLHTADQEIITALPVNFRYDEVRLSNDADIKSYGVTKYLCKDSEAANKSEFIRRNKVSADYIEYFDALQISYDNLIKLEFVSKVKDNAKYKRYCMIENDNDRFAVMIDVFQKCLEDYKIVV